LNGWKVKSCRQWHWEKLNMSEQLDLVQLVYEDHSSSMHPR
jgi:hypothetical protein